MRIENKGVNVFQGLMVPEENRLAGWAALTQALAVKGPARNRRAYRTSTSEGASARKEPGAFSTEGIGRGKASEIT